MTYLLTFFPLYFLQLSLHLTPIKANLCKITAGKVIYTFDTKINIANTSNFLVNYSTELNSIPLALDTYGGILNAVLLNNGEVKFFDNKLNQVYTLDLSALNIFSPSLIAIWSASEIYVYDNFEQKFYLIDFVNHKIKNTVQAALDEQPVELRCSGKKLYILTQKHLWELTATKELIKTFKLQNVKSFYLTNLGIWTMTNDKLSLDCKNCQTNYEFKEKLQKICGVEQDKIFVLTNHNQLAYIITL